MRLTPNKKGSAIDVIVILITVFFIAIFFPIFRIMTDRSAIAFENAGVNDEANLFKPGNARTERFTSMVDILPILALLFLTIIAAWLAFQNPTSPILIFFMLFLIIAIILYSVIIANAYEKFAGMNQNITDAVAAMPKTKHTMDRLPVYGTISFFIVMTVFFLRRTQ